MFKKFCALTLSLVLLGSATPNNECTQVAGIKIWKETMAFARQENFPYCALLQRAVSKDKRALKRLAFKTFDTSAGLGHGTVIVALVHRLGERFFIRSIGNLTPKKRQHLLLNLKVGLAYTNIKKYHEKDVKVVFPKLARLLK